MRALVVVAFLWGCDVSLSEMDNIYSRGTDRQVVCSFSVDDKNVVSTDTIATGLDRARIDGTALHLYAHWPTKTVDVSTLELVLGGAVDRDMDFVTYRDLADGTKTAGLAFSFDGPYIQGWYPLRPLFEHYGAKVTFFVSHFWRLNDDEVRMLRDLAADGHDIEYHSTIHLDAEEFAEANGIARYLEEDIFPDLERLRAAGFDPISFSYPYGSRTAAIDAALLQHFKLLRAIRYTCPY
jgi:Polysaccharide deacetylase